ncbi:hypothetical protein [Sphingomonas profundi]|uniref:hypothetical protein n=1 Tax=Alterirhizorhabdus profundi TaxID=2681549 RepID=UPI0012E6FD85|nr:hypothetical protein [Sphingomonas profundi]
MTSNLAVSHPIPYIEPRYVRVPAERTRTRASGPVGTIQADLAARLTAGEYEAWLLPPEPRGGIEQVVHALSLGAAFAAVTGVAGLIWLLI